ncbi:uncharacterized protein BJ171DRAFT_309827 [Polychytrium aggregatum]|uniref:uncharacterized protein n=1 Tax=Polychytrium aggregatum TaxID=110093 RepID=UPI0022FEA70C|nr:uncharacterized protein BJ171DRAFT_309827 [Polychytrium aggregatum]KAI9206986.1 hypothetical protein BJ171DRAFT_309827 [Polychytrium aggregatum]
MRIFITAIDREVQTLDIDSSMTLRDLSPLIEADLGIPVAEQIIVVNGVALRDMDRSLSALGILQDTILLVSRKASHQPATPGSTAFAPGNEIEALRQQILSSPQRLAQLRAQNPQLAHVLVNNPAEFARQLRLIQQQQQQQGPDMLPPGVDLMDASVQRRIEEEIRQNNINLNRAVRVDTAG